MREMSISGVLFKISLLWMACLIGPGVWADGEMPDRPGAGVYGHGVYGQWVPPDGDVVIRIADCDNQGEALCATLVRHAYENLSRTDVLNPEPGLQSRPLIGVDILRNAGRVGEDRWKGGNLYDPRTGKTYFAKLRLVGPDRVRITGCAGKAGIKANLCKGYVWRRARPGQILRPGKLVGAPAGTSP